MSPTLEEIDVSLEILSRDIKKVGGQIQMNDKNQV
jgi:hypothetical protein